MPSSYSSSDTLSWDSLVSLSDDDIVPPRWRLEPDDDSIINEAIGLPGFFDSAQYPGTTWELGKMQSEKIRSHVVDGYSVADVGGVCIATQVEGPSIGLKAVAKIKMQITPLEDSDSEPGAWPNDKPSALRISPEIEREIGVLEKLTELNCSCTPKLYEYTIAFQPESAKVKNGYIMVVIMEKVPGHNLDNFDSLSLEERDRIRIAFAKSFMEFGSLGFTHCDPARRNLIWDKKNDKCYIVDLEDVIDCGRLNFWPGDDFRMWQLASPQGRGVNEDSDPMVPPEHSKEHRYDSKEEYLASIATMHDR